MNDKDWLKPMLEGISDDVKEQRLSHQKHTEKMDHELSDIKSQLNEGNIRFVKMDNRLVTLEVDKEDRDKIVKEKRRRWADTIWGSTAQLLTPIIGSLIGGGAVYWALKITQAKQ